MKAPEQNVGIPSTLLRADLSKGLSLEKNVMTSTTVSVPSHQSIFESVSCYYCGGDSCTGLTMAEDDLTGKPGSFRYVTCKGCGLAYQNPRIDLRHIRTYYDHEYIAHRKKTDWGVLTGLFNYAMDGIDRNKDKLLRKYVRLTPASDILDVGCGAGTFLSRMRGRYGTRVTGVDFKDLSHLPAFNQADFRCGLFYEQEFDNGRFDVVTMWHFLEHDYNPLRTLRTAAVVMKPDGRLLIEVPRLDCLTFRIFRERWPGLQAPQHTVLYSKDMLLKIVEKAGLEIVDYLPYGAYPAYFYLFAGTAFKCLKGRGLNLSKAIGPYFLGQIALSPVLLFENQLNLAMQTVVCRRPL